MLGEEKKNQKVQGVGPPGRGMRNTENEPDSLYCHAAHSDAQERPEARYTAKCRLTTVSIFVSETKKVNTSCIYLGLNSLLEGPGSCLHMAEGPDQGPLQL